MACWGDGSASDIVGAEDEASSAQSLLKTVFVGILLDHLCGSLEVVGIDELFP